jgi:hypothetical protein
MRLDAYPFVSPRIACFKCRRQMLSHHNPFSAAVTTNIAESNFRYRQAQAKYVVKPIVEAKISLRDVPITDIGS